MSTKSDVEALVSFLREVFLDSCDDGVVLEGADGEMTASPTPEHKESFDYDLAAARQHHHHSHRQQQQQQQQQQVVEEEGSYDLMSRHDRDAGSFDMTPRTPQVEGFDTGST
jgi:hypothetical protein